MFRKKILAQLLFVAAGTIIVPAVCLAKSSPIEARIDRLEQLLENQVTMDTLKQLSALQDEVRELRGLQEEQAHKLKLLDQRQEKLFTEIENKIINNAGNTNNSSNNNSVSVKQSSEQESYDAAYQLMENKRYKEALLAFSDLIWQYPNGKYTPNAEYWIGEIHLAEWNRDKTQTHRVQKAIESFNKVSNNYKNHHKAVDSLLKLGLIEIEQENWQAAKSYLTDLKDNFPESSRAQIAVAKLQGLQQEGRI